MHLRFLGMLWQQPRVLLRDAAQEATQEDHLPTS